MNNPNANYKRDYGTVVRIVIASLASRGCLLIMGWYMGGRLIGILLSLHMRRMRVGRNVNEVPLNVVGEMIHRRRRVVMRKKRRTHPRERALGSLDVNV
jgi:hypothetical protein